MRRVHLDLLSPSSLRAGDRVRLERHEPTATLDRVTAGFWNGTPGFVLHMDSPIAGKGGTISKQRWEVFLVEDDRVYRVTDAS